MGTGKDLWNELETHYGKLDYTGLAKLFASDAVHVDAFGRHEGREAIRTYMEEGDKPFSDLRMETWRLIEEADTVVGEWTGWGTHTGPSCMPDGTEIPATGKTAGSSRRDGVIRCRDGKFGTSGTTSDVP